MAETIYVEKKGEPVMAQPKIPAPGEITLRDRINGIDHLVSEVHGHLNDLVGQENTIAQVTSQEDESGEGAMGEIATRLYVLETRLTDAVRRLIRLQNRM